MSILNTVKELSFFLEKENCGNYWVEEEDREDIIFRYFFDLPKEFETKIPYKRLSEYNYHYFIVFSQNAFNLTNEFIEEALLFKIYDIYNSDYFKFYSEMLFILKLLDTEQLDNCKISRQTFLEKIEHRNRFFPNIENYNRFWNESEIKKYFNKNSLLYFEKTKNKTYFRKNIRKRILKSILIKFTFEQILLNLLNEILEKRYAPEGKGYLEAMNDFYKNC